jgi:NAD(P)-dependent dehydrogenase (short-subunit alcohol dehydrogenase family)
MNRVVVVTGAASGIGAATASYLRERGARVGLRLSWLMSPENTPLTGQVLFADGGFESRLRGDVVPQASAAASAAMAQAAAGR